MLVSLHEFSIRQRLFQRKMHIVECIFSHCITKQNLLELEVIVILNMRNQEGHEHRQRDEQFEVNHHAKGVQDA